MLFSSIPWLNLASLLLIRGARQSSKSGTSCTSNAKTVKDEDTPSIGSGVNWSVNASDVKLVLDSVKFQHNEIEPMKRHWSAVHPCMADDECNCTDEVRVTKTISGLPTEDKARKRLQLWTFLMEYFPDAFLAVVDVAVAGNDQHNSGQPLHWAREKSKDQMNTAFRHQFDYGRGVKKDIDNQWHLAKAIWRLSAQLQLDIEEERRNESHD